MTMSNSFEAFTYVRESAPFFTIASIFQKDPQVLIGHPDTGFDGFEDLKGRTLLIGSGGASPTGRTFARSSDCATTSSDLHVQHGALPCRPNVVQQGFVSSEPYSISKAIGRMPPYLLLADAGFSAYQTTIAISRKLAAEKRD